MRFCFTLLAFVVVAALASCKKDGPDPMARMFDSSGPYLGVWIEKSQKKDTLNFDTPKSLLEQLPLRPPSNAGTFVMGSQTYKDYDGSERSPGGVYAYYRTTDSIYIYSYFSSDTKFRGYEFRLSSDHKTFTIDKFYIRPGLPEEVEFLRIR